MMVAAKALLLVTLVIAVSLTTCHGQARGDLRLVNTTVPKNESNMFDYEVTGRLEIFLDDKWSTFCGIDYVGADIAC